MNALWIASVQAAVLAVIVATVLAVLDRRAPDALPPRVRHALWWVVVLRLALPISLPDPAGIPRPTWWVEAAAPWQAVPRPAPSATPRDADRRFDWPVATVSATDPARSRAPTPVTASPEPATRALPTPSPHPALGAEEPAARSRSRRPVTSGAGADEITAAAPFDLTGLAWLAVWATGLALFAARAVVAEVTFQKRVLAPAKPAGARAHAALARALASHRARRPVELLETTCLDAPAAHGLRRWRILLPAGLENRLDDAGLDFVVGHELAHLRHRDPATNLLLTAIHAAHWFNPLAWLAVRGVRAEREAIRDADALAADRTLVPDHCARALLAIAGRHRGFHPSLAGLAPGRRASLRRRLEMIVRENPFPRTATWLGGFGCAVIGWAGLFGVDGTGGAPSSPPRATPVAASQNAAPEGGIRVIREVEEPAWEAQVRARLETPVHWSEPLAPAAALARIAQRTELTMTLDPILPEAWDEDVQLPPLAGPLPLAGTLDLIAWYLSQLGETTEWRIVRDGIEFVGCERSPTELRFYQVQPLLAAGHDFDEVVEFAIEADPDWDERQECGVEIWSDQILIQTTQRSHARIHAALERLLAGPTASPPAIAASLATGLATPVEPDREFSPAEWSALAEELGVTVWTAPGFEGDEPTIRSRTDGEVLGTLLRRAAGAHLTVTAGAVLIGESLPLDSWIVDVAPLAEPTANERREWAENGEDPADWLPEIRAEKRDRLQDLILQYADPRSWESVERCQIRTVGETLLIVRNTQPALEHVERFLRAARRARGDG